MKKLLIYAMLLGAGFVLGRWSRAVPAPGRVVEVLTRVDTILVDRPVPVVERALPAVVEALPLIATRDTVYVEVPRVQYEYQCDDYRVWVSGHLPALDSIEIYRHSSLALVASPSRKKFAVGLQAGVGITPRGIQPFIGVGVSFNIAEF